MGLQIDGLLSPISDDSPCGPYVHTTGELYTDFNALEQSAQGKPEQVMGDAVIPAIEPNWGKVQDVALSLLKRTKDLSVSCYLAQSELNKRGFLGLLDGLCFVNSLLTKYWDSVHPCLMIDDDDDPDYRINAVAYLASDMFRQDLANAILVESRAVGRFSLKDYRMATGEIEARSNDGGQGCPDIGLINAAFMDVPLEELQVLRDAVAESIENAEQIYQIFVEKLSVSLTPSIEPLIKDLGDALKVYENILSERGVSVSLEQENSHIDEVDADSGNTSVKVAGEVNSREDVLKHIDKICKYYDKNEPSSPVPLVLNRAKKLVTMDFMEIIKDMSPDSIQSIMNLAGINEE